mmetsp:Transcript_5410/g.11940  ORF Transcript_5410/g.11940 Transcript_5410/m.11940 type:complete len:348 (+) Transcript_5410:769-1812(+)
MRSALGSGVCGALLGPDTPDPDPSCSPFLVSCSGTLASSALLPSPSPAGPSPSPLAGAAAAVLLLEEPAPFSSLIWACSARHSPSSFSFCTRSLRTSSGPSDPPDCCRSTCFFSMLFSSTRATRPASAFSALLRMSSRSLLSVARTLCCFSISFFRPSNIWFDLVNVLWNSANFVKYESSWARSSLLVSISTAFCSLSAMQPSSSLPTASCVLLSCSLACCSSSLRAASCLLTSCCCSSFAAASCTSRSFLLSRAVKVSNCATTSPSFTLSASFSAICLTRSSCCWSILTATSLSAALNLVCRACLCFISSSHRLLLSSTTSRFSFCSCRHSSSSLSRSALAFFNSV